MINNITVDPNASGNFTLLIDHPTGGERGAEHWKAGDLTYAGGTCTIAGVDLSGNICADGSSAADIVVEVVTGDINVGGHLSVSSALDRTFTANSVAGDINLGGMWGDLVVNGAFDGDLNEDGVVDLLDLSLMLSRFGVNCW